MSHQKNMLRITRSDGRENFLSQSLEDNFMRNVLNKTDRKVTKVERGTLLVAGEKREFIPSETIWISKSQETKDLAKKAFQIAEQKDIENQELRAKLAQLEASGPDAEAINKARAEAATAAQKAAEEAARAEAATAEAGSAAEQAKVLQFTLQSKDEELARQAAEIEALKKTLEAAKKKAAGSSDK